ncbi:MAG: histidine kinase [Betaproteobacteria bacterium]|nr:histidine kinase [Betaproteobacteria bacterium]MDH5287235.1 histidine kinase [Betaproteobacteria bacterium]
MTGTAASGDDLQALLEPTLAALIRVAGATAGTLGVGELSVIASAPDAGPRAQAAGIERAGDAFAAWCEACERSGSSDSACVRSRLCRRAEAIPSDAFGAVCEHVVALPLRHRGASVGSVRLMFAARCELPQATLALLGAAADLAGLALDNARLARESLRVGLMAERQLMANEVHDTLAQGLTYMRMRMSLLRDAVREGDEGRVIKLCADVDETLTDSHHRLRELIVYFRSRMDPRGLNVALAEAAGSFRERTGIAVEYANRMADLSLPAAREIEVFHIVQEALANVSRHSGARRVRVVLERGGADCRVAVEDDGVGIGQAVVAGERGANGHFGIAIMQERARRLGGELAVVPVAAGGTAVRLRFPAAAPTEATST